MKSDEGKRIKLHIGGTQYLKKILCSSGFRRNTSREREKGRGKKGNKEETGGDAVQHGIKDGKKKAKGRKPPLPVQMKEKATGVIVMYGSI